MPSGLRRLREWIWAALLCAAYSARANGPIGDAPVFAQTQALRPVAAAIAIDGDGADWGAIPELPDPSGDASGGPSRDITGVAIAPLVRIRTAGSPSTYDLAFWLYVDFMGQQFVDLDIGLYLGFDDILWTYPASGPPTFQYWSDSTTAIGNAVEARIPYAQLAAALPAAGTPVPVEPALDGSSYVDQGGFGLGTRAVYWGYDLWIVDNALHPDVPSQSSDLADSISFGQTVRASRAGTVISTAATASRCCSRT